MDDERATAQARRAGAGTSSTPKVRPNTPGPTTGREYDMSLRSENIFAPGIGKSDRSVRYGTEARALAQDLRETHVLKSPGGVVSIIREFLRRTDAQESRF